MTEPTQMYVPIEMISRQRRQAVRVWLIGMAVVFVWVALIVAAPVAKAYGIVGVSTALYHFFGYICHQLSDRSFHVMGESFGVCSRCFGVYFGILAGFLVYPLWRQIDEIEPIPRFWLILSLFPIGIDWSLTIFGVWENTFLSRFVTGLLLGFACATFIVPAIVEITRNLTYRRSRV